MRIDHNRHHFTQTYPTCGERRRLPLGHQSLVPRGLKLQTKVVNVTKKRYDLHNENLLGRGVLVALTTVLKRSLVSYSSRSAQLVDFIKQLRRTQVHTELSFRCSRMRFRNSRTCARYGAMMATETTPFVLAIRVATISSARSAVVVFCQLPWADSHFAAFCLLFVSTSTTAHPDS